MWHCLFSSSCFSPPQFILGPPSADLGTLGFDFLERGDEWPIRWQPPFRVNRDFLGLTIRHDVSLQGQPMPTSPEQRTLDDIETALGTMCLRESQIRDQVRCGKLTAKAAETKLWDLSLETLRLIGSAMHQRTSTTPPGRPLRLPAGIKRTGHMRFEIGGKSRSMKLS